MANFLGLFLITLFWATTAWKSEISKAQWDFFKTQHNRTYESPAEESFRLAVFMNNLEKINEHNALYDRGLVSYKLGLNQFSDLTEEEFQKTFSLSENWLDEFLDDDFVVQAPELNINQTQLPTSVDWRSRGAVTPVKNQGTCGSCWAFGTTGALEAQWFKKTHRLVQLSEQNLLDCTGRYGNNGCRGGNVQSSLRYIKNNRGIDTEKSYPYVGRVGRCRYRANKRGASVSNFVQFRGERQLQARVSSIGPIAVRVKLSPDFRWYNRGVYNNPRCGYTSNPLLHIMLVVGYGTERGQNYWLVKNSWGVHWGKGGYVKMARNKGNQCGIADFPVYPIV